MRVVLRRLASLQFSASLGKARPCHLKVRHVDRVGRRVHCCRHRLAAHSLVHDLDVAIIHVPGAAGVSVERRDIGVTAHRDVNDVFVLIDRNAASENVCCGAISGAVWERTYKNSRRRRLRTTRSVGSVAGRSVDYRDGEIVAITNEDGVSVKHDPDRARRRAGGKRGHHVLRRRVDYRNGIVVRVGNVERVIAGIKA